MYVCSLIAREWTHRFSQNFAFNSLETVLRIYKGKYFGKFPDFKPREKI